MTKEDGNLRTYDSEGYKLRAGCVCVKDERQKEVLLVSSSKYVNRWIIPAGAIEPGEDPVTAAIREVEEEAGVKGKILNFLGIFKNDISRSKTYVYTLIVDDSASLIKSKENRARKWFLIDDAIRELTHKPVQKDFLFRLLELHTLSSNLKT